MQLRIFTEPQQGARYSDLLAVAQRAEQLGFDAFFRSDHYLKMGSVDGQPGPSDAWTTLAGLARDTTRIRLGTLVNSATFRHPGVLAISVANVDDMSGGRVELGLGAGWFEAEHLAYGITFPEVRERFDVLEEQLAIIDGLWRTPTGGTFTFAGHHYSVVDSPALPKPVQSPPPIIVGGRGAVRTPALAARHAAEFNVAFPGDGEFERQRDRVRAACESIGRDPASMTMSVALCVACGASDAEVARRAATIGREPEELRANGLCGTPDEIVERLALWASRGVQRTYLQVLDLTDLDQLDLVASAVMPHLAVR
jgi:F420-dependent oxidoreductase-like protein